MDDNTAAVLALAIMGGTVAGVVWLIAWMRIRVRRTELEYDRQHPPVTAEELMWPDGLRIREPGDRSPER